METNLKNRGNVRVYGALVLGAGFVVSALFLGNNTNQIENTENAAEVVAAVSPNQRTYIQTYDSDGDGLRDWEEELLRGEEPIIINASGTYSAPETLTGQFGVDFFTEIAEAQTLGSYAPSQEVLVQNQLTVAEIQNRDKLYTKTDLFVSDNTSETALRLYGNDVAHIMENAPESISELEAVILRDALFSQNKDRLNDLDPIAANYRYIRDNLLALSVPSSLANEHLDLVNIFNIMLNNIEGMRLAFDDPLKTMFRIRRYEQDVQGMYLVFQNLLLSLNNKNIDFNETEPGFAFYAFTPHSLRNEIN